MQFFSLFVNTSIFDVFSLIFQSTFNVFFLISVTFFRAFAKNLARIYKDSIRGRAPAWAGGVSRSGYN